MASPKSTTTLHQAHEVGQSIWYDNMRRGLLRSGALRDLVEKGVRGLTSNPTIFEKAIVASTDYEEALKQLTAEKKSTLEIYEALVIEDLRGACDLLLSVNEESKGVDGRVSLEVLPQLATNTEKTISEGLRLAKLIGRPNIMIKVPATPEGIPAIRALTAQGVSVNITLIFALDKYEEVVDAYLSGLEDRKAAGGSFAGLASVASFFVSRVDSACDKLLKEKAAASPAEAARLQGAARQDRDRQRQERLRHLPADDRLAALEGAGRRRREPAAAALGLDRDQGSELPGHLLRRRAHGTRHGRHRPAGHAGRVHRPWRSGVAPRHAISRAPRRPWPSSPRWGSTSGRSARGSWPTA